MRNKGIWQKMSLNSYSFVQNDKGLSSIAFDYTGVAVGTINNKTYIFPDITINPGSRLPVTSEDGHSMFLFNYWLGTGKAQIDGHTYNFKRKDVSTTICVDENNDTFISFEEIDSFNASYTASYDSDNVEIMLILICIGFLFYMTFKRQIY